MKRPEEPRSLSPALEAIVLDALRQTGEEREERIDELCAAYATQAAAIREFASCYGFAVGALDALEAPAERLPELPERIAGYRVKGRVGDGGMGTVLLAEEAGSMGRRVAIKLIKHGRAGPRVSAQFEAERRALALMNHANIARPFAEGVSDEGWPYFVMEYVDGVPLTAYCDTRRLSVRERLELFLPICEAVQHAHQKGILHRDLKPSNVLVEEVDGKAVPKVIDFGVAKALDFKLSTETIVETGRIVGTPEYMSPEQAEGLADIDTRTDIYALGMLLYELLTGELPYPIARGGELIATLRAILESEAIAPSRRVRELPADRAGALSSDARSVTRALRELDWIVLTALAKDREERYASAAALADDLRRYLRGDAVSVAPPSVGYRVAKLVARNKATALALLALVLAVAIAFFLVLRSLDETRRERAKLASLLDSYYLQDYEREADELWPAVPARRARFASWLDKVDALVARRDALRALRARSAEDGALEIEARIGDLLARLDRFVEPEFGLLARVRAGKERADTLAARTIDSKKGAWDAAIASIANEAECPLYRGLRVDPQLGFVPLARNAAGLWEFVYACGGTTPSSGERARPREGDDPIFVLVPPGSFWMGAERREPKGTAARSPAEHGQWDESALPREGPVQRVTLDAFFLAKYELTQAQWLRLVRTRENPSGFRVGYAETPIGPTHPVERVSWTVAMRELGRLGLTLPTEAQWEYAARAGTRTRYYWGDVADELGQRLNVADQSVLRLAKRMGRNINYSEKAHEGDDGFPAHAPVGSFPPNPWGFFDILGNVAEWCRDVHASYSRSVRAGDGLRLDASGIYRVVRGPGYSYTAREARVTYRANQALDARRLSVGMRPAKALQRAEAR